MVRMACLGTLAALLLCAARAASQEDAKITAARGCAKAIDSVLWGSTKDDSVAPDTVFVRRAYLDLAGRIPSASEAKAFLADASPGKRAKLIDQLIDSDDFADLCARFWEYQLLGNYREFKGQIAGKDVDGVLRAVYPRFHKWMVNQVKNETSWLKVFGELINATGEIKDDPAALYKAALFGEGEFHEYFADRMSRSIFGIRITCAQCHDHPFDRWTMEDYHGLAAFAARVRAKPVPNKENPSDYEIFENDKGEVAMPATGKVMKPKFLFGGEPPPGMPRLTALAQFSVQAGAAQIDRNVINRVWQWLAGRGFVEPVDDWNQRNKATQMSALTAIRNVWIDKGRSMKFLFRAICNSKYYQRTYTGGGVGAFKSAGLRPLTGEQLLTSLVTAQRGDRGAAFTQVADRWGALREELVSVYGIHNDWTEMTVLPGNTRQVLMTRNGGFVRSLLNVHDLKGGPDEKLDHMFLALLTRPPTREERERYSKHLADSNWGGLEDILWTLANSAEFLLRH